MNTQKIQNFIDLVTFDQNVVDLEQKIQSTAKKIQNLQNDLDTSSSLVDTKLSHKKESKKQLDVQELNVKEIQEKEVAQVKVLEHITNTKEYDAANKELELLRSKRDQAEKKLVSMWNTYESLEKDVVAFQETEKEKRKSIEDSIDQEKKSLQTYQSKLDELSRDRDAKITQVPEEWMNLYDNMRGRVSNPVVRVEQDSCSACFHVISSRDLQVLQSGELLQCKSCYRFLYVDTSD